MFVLPTKAPAGWSKTITAFTRKKTPGCLKQAPEAHLHIELAQMLMFSLCNRPVMKNLEDCLGKESWPFDRPIIVKNLCPLQVDVESATYVSPHDDICDVCIRRKGIRRKVLVPR